MGKSYISVFGIAVLSLFMHGQATALDRDTMDPRAILQAVYDQRTPPRSMSRLKLTIRDKAGVRERLLWARSLRAEGVLKSLTVIEAPADLRNTGFLSLDYQQPERSDEQWLYLPKLRRTTRVPESGKSDSFVGSDFSYADMSQENPRDYEFALIEGTVKVGGEDCWLIEARPHDEHVRERTGYIKQQVWISKEKLIPLQAKFWLTATDKVKYLKVSDIRQVEGGGWVPYQVQMRSLRAGTLESESMLEILSMSYAAELVNDADFTQQHLEQGL
jgi:hypothetical protein